MLHIILAILKIVGILLAVLILLLILALFIFLFVPFRYCVKLKKDGPIKEAEVYARVGWLFGAASVEGGYHEEKLSAFFRVLWFRKQLLGTEHSSDKKTDGEIEKKSAEAQPSAEKKVYRENTKLPDTLKTAEHLEEPDSRNPKETSEQPEVLETKKSLNVQTQKMTEISGKKKGFRKKFRFPDIVGFINKCISSIIDFFRNLRNLFQSFGEKWRKFQVYLDFLQSQMTKEAAGILKRHLFYLLRHIRPRRIRGKLHYGFEDPGLTGQLTGIFYLILPAKGCRVELEPDFESLVCEGDLVIAGYIRICHIVKVALQIFFDKKLKAYWKNIKQLRRS